MNMKTRLNSLDLPSTYDLTKKFLELSEKNSGISICKNALEQRFFKDSNGDIDDFGDASITLQQAAIISHLCEENKKELSIEVGFGAGISAFVILSKLKYINREFEHIIFDPYGLSGGRGNIVEKHLQKVFINDFKRIRKPSEIGLAQLLDERGTSCAGFIFIDGGHRFEHVMTDFSLADKLCCEGGYIVFDDALFPAVEAGINYIAANRVNYAISHLTFENTCILKKISRDTREWCAFEPFEVPNRRNWTPSTKS